MRRPRILQDGARYHVSARAHQKRFILETVADKTLFLDVVARAKEKYGFRLESLCVMNSHFHAIVHPRAGTSLSRIFQWILSVFAQAWNRRHGLFDRVWGPRFFSRIIEGVRAFRVVLDYIDLNPVRARLVRDHEDWPFGRIGLRRRTNCRLRLDDPPD